MLFLGIDPGSRKAGYGLLRQVGKKLIYVDSGVLRYDGTPEFIDRLGLIYQSCKKLIEHYSPDEVAIESLIYVKNVNSLAKLAQARGAMVAAFMETHQKRVFEYAPNLIKSSVTGHGHADKDAVEKTLSMIFGQKINFKTNDESDALAIAVCHALNRGQPQVRVGGGRKSQSLRQAFKHLE